MTGSSKSFWGLPSVRRLPITALSSASEARFSPDITRLINHELLAHFASRGLTINEGIAIDTRLVRSASHPLTEDKRKEERKKREAPEDKLDRNDKPLKFSHDLESDWTVQNNISHYGLKEHAPVDSRYGFAPATEITPASFHDSPYLPLCVAGSWP